MSFSKIISGIAYKQPVVWQNLDSLGKNDAWILAALLAYRRPNLLFIDTSNVDVENNSPTANATQILFPDMEIRSVTEDTTVTTQYRRWTVSETAQFTTGTEESGLRTGLTATANTWYAIYAVKSLINVRNFVLVGDTTLPLQANYATLNAAYGTDSWLYLGMVRYGDNDLATTSILDFTQAGAYTKFKNSIGDSQAKLAGIQVTAGSGIYTATFGTGATNIPNHCKLVTFGAETSSNVAILLQDATGARTYFAQKGAGGGTYADAFYYECPATEGINTTGRASIAGWYDGVLGIGFNPII